MKEVIHIRAAEMSEGNKICKALFVAEGRKYFGWTWRCGTITQNFAALWIQKQTGLQNNTWAIWTQLHSCPAMRLYLRLDKPVPVICRVMTHGMTHTFSHTFTVAPAAWCVLIASDLDSFVLIILAAYCIGKRMQCRDFDARKSSRASAIVLKLKYLLRALKSY